MSEQPEIPSEKKPETVFCRLRRHRRIATWGIVLTATGFGLPVVGGALWPLPIFLIPLGFFGIALLLTALVLLIRNHTARVACATLLLFIATELAVLFAYEVYAGSGAVVDDKSEEEVTQIYEQIQNGMTRQSVVALLGRPTSMSFEADQNKGSVESWRYRCEALFCGPLGNWDYLEVSFNAEGKVVYKFLGD